MLRHGIDHSSIVKLEPRPDDTEEDVAAYIALLQKRRGLGYDTLSANNNGGGHDLEQPKLWTLHCQRCLADCALGETVRRGWSLSGHLRAVEAQNGGHMGTGVAPNRLR